ncbi:MAG: thioredoxin family protein [Phycisphaerae bacterium]
MQAGFAIVTVLVLGLIVWHQQSGPDLGWEDDLDAQLAQAREADRPVLVFFSASPPSEAARKLMRVSLRKQMVAQPLKRENYIKVRTVVDRDLTEDLAVKYRLKELPTLMVLDPKGKEVGRLEGYAGETAINELLKKIDRESEE